MDLITKSSKFKLNLFSTIDIISGHKARDSLLMVLRESIIHLRKK